MMASLTPALSVTRHSSSTPSSFRGRAIEHCKDTQLGHLRFLEASNTTSDWPHPLQLSSRSNTGCKDISSRLRSLRAVLGERGPGANEDTSSNDSQAKLQQSGTPSRLETSIVPSRAVAGKEEALLSDTPGCRSEATGVELESEGLILGSGEGGAWDSSRVGSPIVRRYVSDNEERWCMWYAGDRGDMSAGTCVGLATSSNGMHWRRGKAKAETNGHDEEGGVGLVMGCSSNWWAFDTQHLYPSDVLIMSSAKVRAASGVYWLYYSGVDAEELEPPTGVRSASPLASERFLKGRMRPGLAISNDGRNWARIEGDHHSGALLDVGAEGEWDSLFIAAPQVVFHEAFDIRMFYHSLDMETGASSVGFARSRDGVKWLKFGKILEGGKEGAFDELGISNRHVVEDPNGFGYLMIYEGIGADGRTSIGLARSDAGLLKWERCQEEPIFRPGESERAWDSAGVGSPCLVHMGGDEWRLYYVGVSCTGETAIGMATNVGDSLTEFTRWHGFHL